MGVLLYLGKGAVSLESYIKKNTVFYGSQDASSWKMQILERNFEEKIVILIQEQLHYIC